MDIILIPGLWLNASSWDAVVSHLEAAGHRVRALTLPGMESKDADRAGISVEDHVEAIVGALDDADGPALLVGHSAGSGLAWAAGVLAFSSAARTSATDRFSAPSVPSTDFA